MLYCSNCTVFFESFDNNTMVDVRVESLILERCTEALLDQPAVLYTEKRVD